MRSGLGDGARLVRASFELVREDPQLLWFPVLSTCCVLLTAGFWVFEGAWLVAVHGPWLLFVPLVLAAVYSVTFVGIFFSVALTGSAADALAGREPSFSQGISLAWSRLGGIAGWAAVSLAVSFVLGMLQSAKGLRIVGAAAQTAWSFATFFVVPLIAFEGLGAGDARRRSFELARLNWRQETGGLGTLRLLTVLPALAFVYGGKLLVDGHVHSAPAEVLAVCGIVLAAAALVVAGVVRQVFAVSLYESAARIA
jgi:uncharacterized membrane protein YccF (DUF307 family)